MNTHQMRDAAASALIASVTFACANSFTPSFATATIRRQHTCALRARFDRAGLRRR